MIFEINILFKKEEIRAIKIWQTLIKYSSSWSMGFVAFVSLITNVNYFLLNQV